MPVYESSPSPANAAAFDKNRRPSKPQSSAEQTKRTRSPTHSVSLQATDQMKGPLSPSNLFRFLEVLQNRPSTGLESGLLNRSCGFSQRFSASVGKRVR